MGGRGTFAAGNPVPYTYETVGKYMELRYFKALMESTTCLNHHTRVMLISN